MRARGQVKVTRGSGAAVIDGRGQAKLVPAHTNPAHTRTQPPDTSSTIALTALTPRQSPSLAPAWLFVATVMTRKKNDTGHRVQAHRYLMSCFCGICQCHSGHVLPDRTPPPLRLHPADPPEQPTEPRHACALFKDPAEGLRAVRWRVKGHRAHTQQNRRRCCGGATEGERASGGARK